MFFLTVKKEGDKDTGFAEYALQFYSINQNYNILEVYKKSLSQKSKDMLLFLIPAPKQEGLLYKNNLFHKRLCRIFFIQAVEILYCLCL